MMGDFDRREAEKRDAERSKNDLEAYIISTGGLLEDGAYDEVNRSVFRLPWLSLPFYFHILDFVRFPQVVTALSH